MKLEKLNLNKIETINEQMKEVFGGTNVGETRIVYCNGGSSATLGQPSTDRRTEMYSMYYDVNGNTQYFWQDIGGITYLDPPSTN